MPKLIIRKFYREAHKCQEFWDSFKSSVHENTSLSPTDKFNYLRTLIEEPVYSAIAGLSLTEANYETALELLKKRYGKRQTIKDSHIDAILKIEPLQNSADISQLPKSYDTVEQHCWGLKALDVQSASYGTVLVNVLLRSLPENIKLVISWKMTDSDWTFEKLLENLKTEIEAREKCSAMSSKQQETKRNYRNQPSTASALSTAGRNNTQSCTFCKGTNSTEQNNAT